jgi:predicted Zn-dependent protease
MKEFLKMVRKFIENLKENPHYYSKMTEMNEGTNDAEAATRVLNAFLVNSNKLHHIGLTYKNLLSEASKYYETTKYKEKCDKYNKNLEVFLFQINNMQIINNSGSDLYVLWPILIDGQY